MNGFGLRCVVLGAAALLPFAGVAQTNDQGMMNPGMANPANPNPTNMGPAMPEGNMGPAPVTPSNTSMRDSLGAPGVTGREMRDDEFLRRATEGGLAQIAFAKVAIEKGSADVKEFAQKMLDDHTAINKDLAGVADQLGVMVPTRMNKQDQAELSKLSSLKGDAFDREYITVEVRDHREDLHQFRLEVMNATDQNLQNQVAKQAGTLREHMRLSSELAQEKGIPVPPRPPRPNAPPAPPQAASK